MRFLLSLVFAYYVSCEFSLSLLFMGELRGNYVPINSGGSPCAVPPNSSVADNPNCVGGLWGAAYWIERLRSRPEFPNSLFAVMADFCQGTYFSNLIKVGGAYQFWDLLGADLVLLGPRDLDFLSSEDPDLVFANYSSKFPTMLSTGEFNGTYLSNTIRWKIFPFGSELVGVFAISPLFRALTQNWPPNVTVISDLVTANTAVDYLTSKGVNKIIMYSGENSFTSDAVSIAQSVPGIDVVVYAGASGIVWRNSSNATGYGGPFPTIVTSPSGRQIITVVSGSYLQYFGYIDIIFDDFGNVISYAGDSLPVTPAFTPTNYTLKVKKQVIDTYNRVTSTIGSKVVGSTLTVLNATKSFIRYNEAPIGSFVADALREKGGTQLAIINAGALRLTIPPGNITSGKISALVPFTDFMQTVVIPALDFIELLQLAVDQVIYQNNTAQAPDDGRFLQISGFRFSFNPFDTSLNYTTTGAANNYNVTMKVVSVEILNNVSGQYEPIDLRANYTLTAIAYLVSGGDNYDTFTKPEIVKNPATQDLFDVVLDYVESHSPLNYTVEGRITRSNQSATNFSALLLPPPPQPTWINWSDPIGILFTVLFSFMIFLLLVTMVLLWVLKEEPVIKASSFVFMQIMYLGMIIACVGSYFWIGEPQQASCNLRPWLVGFGFLLSYGSLLVKNYRILVIFAVAKRLKESKFPDQVLAYYLLAVVAPGLLILILWTAIDRLQPSTLEFSTYDSSTNVYWVNCHSKSWGWIGAFIAYMGLLVTCGFLIAFKTRKIEKKFSEALYMGYVTYNFAVFGGISIPLVFLIQDPQGKTIIELARNFGLCFLAWLIMTIPKLFYIHTGKTDRTSTTGTKN